MKQIFVSVFVGMIAWSAAAWWMAPPSVDEQGRPIITWVSDDNRVRREQIDLFNQANQDYHLRLDPNNTGVTKVIVQCTGGIGPEVFDMYFREQLHDYVRAGVVRPLYRYKRDGTVIPLFDEQKLRAELGAPRGEHLFDLSKTWPAIINDLSVRQWNEQEQKYERIQYSFPCNIEAPVVFYNKKIFREAGVPLPPRDWTWDEFRETASKLTKKTDARTYERFGCFSLEWREMIWQNGGSIYCEDQTYCTLDSPEAVEAMQYYYDLMFEHRAMPTPDDRLYMGGQGGWGGNFLQWFSQGQVAMIRVGRWALITFRQNPDLKGNLGACHVPHRKGRKPVVTATSRSAGINKKTPNMNGALKFLAYLASDTYSWQIIRCADAMPPNPALVRTDRYLNDPDHPEEEFNRFFPEAVARGRNLEICPFIQPMSVQRIVNRHLDLMYNQRKSPRQTCIDAAAEVNQRIRENLIKYGSMRREYQRRTGREFDPNDFPPRTG